MKKQIILVVAVVFFPLAQAFSQSSPQSAARGQQPLLYPMIPWGVGFWMEGRVTNVALIGERIQFQITGRFWFTQLPPEGATKPQVIEVHGKDGISAIVSQAEPFFAMSTDWRAGAIRKNGELLKILRTAAERGSVVKFELTQPRMDFGVDQSFSISHATVVRATDVDLK
jgi:hypothetical protein